MRSIYEVKNKDQLCRGRAIVVMHEYAKHKAGEPNCFENVCKNHGKKTQQLKLARELYKAAGVPEDPCGHAEIEHISELLGTKRIPSDCGGSSTWWGNLHRGSIQKCS